MRSNMAKMKCVTKIVGPAISNKYVPWHTFRPNSVMTHNSTSSCCTKKGSRIFQECGDTILTALAFAARFDNSVERVDANVVQLLIPLVHIEPAIFASTNFFLAHDTLTNAVCEAVVVHEHGRNCSLKPTKINCYTAEL